MVNVPFIESTTVKNGIVNIVMSNGIRFAVGESSCAISTGPNCTEQSFDTLTTEGFRRTTAGPTTRSTSVKREAPVKPETSVKRVKREDSADGAVLPVAAAAASLADVDTDPNLVPLDCRYPNPSFFRMELSDIYQQEVRKRPWLSSNNLQA
ncbi:hypothetical protein BT63DRAFT_124233 [Microthyrium microscopicum]|uniref:Uncharacterized protein n=1 Tax=Microthyrium microscopicum TaxID=703497 RepID=A0A6A6TTB8_9PEZI|nr:hypothetical protein BT63DRAFT_124233 [Microthyrium microscopicum]